MCLSIIPWASIRNLPFPDLAMTLLATRTGDSINLNNVLRSMNMDLGESPQTEDGKDVETVRVGIFSVIAGWSASTA